jgi:hypothetical protein
VEVERERERQREQQISRVRDGTLVKKDKPVISCLNPSDAEAQHSVFLLGYILTST